MANDDQDWFEQLINDFLIPIIAGLACGQLGAAKQPLEDYLAGLEKSKEISSSPLVKVMDLDDDSITFLIRGEFSFFKGATTAFMRILVKVAKKLKAAPQAFKIDILDWITVIGEVFLGKKDLFEARLGFGYDESGGVGVFSGRGALKVIPAGFAIDLILGGLSDRGAMVGLKVESPVAIPLGATMLGIKALGGDFAYNFVARLEDNGVAVVNPAAKDYVHWAVLGASADRWKAGPTDETAVGVGIRCDLVTLFDQGRVLKLIDAGVAVLTPGPVFILGGAGKVMLGIADAKGYLAVDIPSASIALGVLVSLLFPPKEMDVTDGGDIVKGSGQLDAFFSFSDPASWYLYFGREKAMVSVDVLKGIFQAGAFYNIDNHRMAFGGLISEGFEKEWWIIKLYASMGIEAYNIIGWNPFELEAYFKLWGEMGIKIWIFKLGFKLSAAVTGAIANPCKLIFELELTLVLPFPLPDKTYNLTLSYSDEDPQPPEISLILMDAERQANTNTVKVEKLGAIHPISGRQWLLGSEKAWPDLEIVIPFASRLEDMTASKVMVSPAISSQNQGGYDMHHELGEVLLKDTVNNKNVKVHGVWADAQGGKTARLHLLGQDPYAWLLPHITPGTILVTTPAEAKLQFFGNPPAETFSAEKRFGEVLILPDTQAGLLCDYSPYLPYRVLACDRLQMRFATSSNAAIQVEDIRLWVIGAERSLASVQCVIGDTAYPPLPVQKVRSLFGSVYLGMVTLPVAGQPVSQVWLDSGGKSPLLIYGIFYVEQRQCVQSTQPKQVLKPGKYKLTVSGKSYGTHADLPDTDVLEWKFSQDFEVVYPDRLRPYIQYATIGDYRLFGKETSAWNPSQYGYGFPHYRGYKGVVHSLVPYLNKIFTGTNALSFHIDYDGKGTQKPASLVKTVKVSKDPNKSSSALQASKDWIAANPGIAQKDKIDDELVLAEGLQDGGPVHLSIWFKPENGVDFKLDEWSAFISQFETFAAHVALSSTWLRVTYDANGKTTHAILAQLRAGVRRHLQRVEIPASTAAGISKLLEIACAPLLARKTYPFVVQGKQMPDEYTTVQAGWELPAALQQYLGKLDAQSAIRFARFAASSGVKLDDGAALNDVVSATAIEALTDSQGRPYALWLRTPEPLDWRRVTGNLKVMHMDFVGDYPAGYAERWPLELNLAILPSPDGSSAFLVGGFNGEYCLLPRGEFELTLTFNQNQAGLWKLRPGTGVSTPETAVLKFVQPHGLDWPRPPDETETLLPFHPPEALLEIYWEIPELLLKAQKGGLGPDDFRTLDRILAGLPDKMISDALRRGIEETRAAYLLRGNPPAVSGSPEMIAARRRQLLAFLTPVVHLAQALAEEEMNRIRREK